MKKAVLILIMLMFGAIAWAASSQTETHITNLPGDVDVWTIAWTSDTDGSYTNYTTEWNVDGYVFMVVTDPGATAPTGAYDITLNDSDGVDIMGGELGDLDASLTEQAVPKIGNAYGTRFVKGPLVLTISNNSVDSAVGEVIIYIWGGK